MSPPLPPPGGSFITPSTPPSSSTAPRTGGWTAINAPTPSSAMKKLELGEGETLLAANNTEEVVNAALILQAMSVGTRLSSDTSVPTTTSRATSQVSTSLSSAAASFLGTGTSSAVSPTDTAVTTPVASTFAGTSPTVERLASPFDDNATPSKASAAGPNKSAVSPKTTPSLDALAGAASSAITQVQAPSTGKAVRTLQDAIHVSKPVDRSLVFPHNFDYETVDSREKLRKYFDVADPMITIFTDDMEEFEGDTDSTRVVSALPLLQQAALDGFDVAAKITHESGTGEAAKDTKTKNLESNKAWDAFLAKFSIPLLKAAAKAGYLVAKREELANAGRLSEFRVCEFCRDEEAGCLSDQYHKDAFRTGVSHFFGRNQTATKFSCLIMPKWCRKHYQKVSYGEESWEEKKCSEIKLTIDRTLNELVKLDKNPSNLRFDIKLRGRDEARAMEKKDGEGDGSPKEGHRHPIHIDTILEVRKNHCGKRKSVADAKALADYADALFDSQFTAFRAGKTDKEIKTCMKKNDGPRFMEFQLVTLWETVFNAAEIAVYKQEIKEKAEQEKARKAAQASAKGRGKGKASPKREADDGSDEEMAEASPSKKARC